jgi:TetR/AcrR family transcriptional repressor of nem operon
MQVTEPSKRRPGRPPKVDGSRLATRERLVRAGIEILTEQGFASTGIAPLDRLRDFVADGKAGLRRFGFRRGCLIGNLGQELGGTHDSLRAPLEAVFRDWQGRVARCLDDAVAAGELAPITDTARLAEIFWIGWEGAILRAKLVRDTTPVDLFAEHFFAGLPHPDH